jgi:hypothetical protein
MDQASLLVAADSICWPFVAMSKCMKWDMKWDYHDSKAHTHSATPTRKAV